jgi:hypothetical protein
MFRRTRIFIAFAVGILMAGHALTTPDTGTQVRMVFAGMLWLFFCVQIGRMFENSGAEERPDADPADFRVYLNTPPQPNRKPLSQRRARRASK